MRFVVLRTGNIDYENNYLTSGERVVMITSVVSEMLYSIYERASSLADDALFCKEVACARFTINEFHYSNAFRNVMSKLGMNRSIHDARHTFIVRARKDEAYLMKIIGA